MEGQLRDSRIEGSRLAGDNPINNDKEQTMPQANKSLEAPLDLNAQALRAVAVRPEPHSFQPITPQIGGAAEVGAVLAELEGLPPGMYSKGPNSMVKPLVPKRGIPWTSCAGKGVYARGWVGTASLLP